MLRTTVLAIIFAVSLAGAATILASTTVQAAVWPPGLPPATAQQNAPAQAPAVATVRVRGLNARSGPGTGYGILTVLRAGEQVDVLGQDNNCVWLYVRRSGEPELLAWIAGGPAYVTLSGACGGIPPVNAPATAALSTPPADQGNPAPAAPETPANGAIILDRRPPGGAYELTAINETSDDGVATLVVPGTTDAIVAFYVHRDDQATVGGIPGVAYEFKFTTGEQWNRQAGRFAAAGQYWSAASPLDFSGQGANFRGYSITMHEVRDGNIGKRQIGPAQFPDLSQP